MEITATDFLNYGIYLAEKGQTDEALSAFCRAIQLQPDYAKAYNNLGLLLHNKGQEQQAKICLCHAIELSPDDAAAYNNFGLVLLTEKNWQAAVEAFSDALARDSCRPELFNNLGLALEAGNRLDEALAAYKQAVGLAPKYVPALINMASILAAGNQLAEAEKYFVQAVASRPEDAEALFSLACFYLLTERYGQGWPLYDRFRLLKASERAADVRRWQGEDLAGKSVLLYYEQGFGDTLQFVRYLPSVAAAAAKTVLWIQPQLAVLMQTSYQNIDVFSGDAIPAGEFDYACPLLSLPGIYHTTAADIPATVPYLNSSVAVCRAWRNRLEQQAAGRKKIGIVWAGNPLHHNDGNRSIPWNVFSRLIACDDRTLWVSLQTGKRAADVNSCTDIYDISAELVDFSVTAAVIDALDLVISVDSAVAHLAGALGKNTWLLLPYIPDWRWQLYREDTPWYPTMRLFRQPAAGDWMAVVMAIKAALADR